MLNKKAQALIEFVLLLPVLIIIVFSAIDVFNLYLKKQELANKLDDEIKLIEKNKETVVDLEKNLEEDNIEITFKETENYLTINAKEKVPLGQFFCQPGQHNPGSHVPPHNRCAVVAR